MGSTIAVGLARMGVGRDDSPIHLHDFDTFEPHNLANQAIQKGNVGQKKVHGLAQQLRLIEPKINVVTHDARVTAITHLEGVVFMCYDQMEDRADTTQYCIEGNKSVKLLIETRMDAQTGIVHSFNPNNTRHMDCWWMYWYPSGHTELTPGCGGQQSIVSAIYGTTCIALKQFELYARKRTRHQIHNRVYSDFLEQRVQAERWPS